MKKSAIIHIAVFSLIVLFAAGSVVAGERVTVIEMADGQHVVFAMTPEEMAVADALGSEWERRKAVNTWKPKSRVMTFEMGESGLTITFPLTEKEMAAEDDDNARREALRAANARKPKLRVIKIELPESGHYVVFPVTEEDRTDNASTENGDRASR